MLSFHAIYFVCSFWLLANAAEWCHENHGETPCNCGHSWFTCRSVKNEKQLADVFQSLRTSLQEHGKLDIPRGFQLESTKSLASLPKDLFKDMTFLRFDLQDAQLDSLGPHDDQESSLNALKETLLTFSLNRINTIDKWNWKSVNLPKVTNLRITESKFNEVPIEFLKAFPNLEELMLVSSEVRHIQPGAFAIQTLKVVGLMDNELKILGQIFAPAISKNLHRLDLSDNLLEDLDLQLLSPLEGLTYLDLGYNKFESMAVEFFKDWHNKKEVSRERLTLKLNGNKFGRDGCETTKQLMEEYKISLEFYDFSKSCGWKKLL